MSIEADLKFVLNALAFGNDDEKHSAEKALAVYLASLEKRINQLERLNRSKDNAKR